MKISASIYSHKENILESVKELDLFRVDYFHIDCTDDLSVFDDIKNIRKISKTPIDLHIITNEPEKYFAEIVSNKIEYVTFQYEDFTGPLNIPDEIKSKLGIAIQTNTPIDVFEKFKENFSFILFMATSPGKSGGLFDKENFDKIREYKKRYPNKLVHVDGGVNKEVSFILRNIGVDCAVSGSYLLRSSSLGLSMLNLKTDLDSYHYHVKDFMIGINQIPIIHANNMLLKDLLLKIEEYKMGFAFIVNGNNKLFGIITDGDIRRALIENINDLNQIKVEEIINTKPIVICADNTIDEMTHLIKSRNIPILFLPVVNRDNELEGVMSFNNLIKGEL
ncbi:MAG: CBS domain-containing protein [bacterium]|nr:CBS domain-containing protein [bacterium]